MRTDGHVLVIGAAGLDIKGHPHAVPQLATSNPGEIRNSFGGVGRNIAENLGRLEIETVLLTVVGDDTYGDLIMAQAAAAGVDVTAVLQVEGGRTGSYVAILDDHGDLMVAVSDYEIMARLDAAYLEQHAGLFEQARMVVSDLNLSPEGIETVVAMCRRAGVPLCVDPTSPSHAPKICGYLDQLFLVTPNASETYALCGMEDPIGGPESAVNAAKRLVASGVQMVIITLGEHGLAYADHAHAGHIEARKTSIVDATGAGDAMSAAVIFGLLNGIEIDEAIRLGKTAAMLTLRSRESVVPELTPDLLYEHLVI